jgi:hypothetical protein
VSLYNIFFLEGEVGKGGSQYIFNCRSAYTIRKCSFEGYLSTLSRPYVLLVALPLVFLITLGINAILKRKKK